MPLQSRRRLRPLSNVKSNPQATLKPRAPRVSAPKRRLPARPSAPTALSTGRKRAVAKRGVTPRRKLSPIATSGRRRVKAPKSLLKPVRRSAPSLRAKPRLERSGPALKPQRKLTTKARIKPKATVKAASVGRNSSARRPSGKALKGKRVRMGRTTLVNGKRVRRRTQGVTRGRRPGDNGLVSRDRRRR